MRYHVRLEPLANSDLNRLRDFLDAFAPDVAERAARILRDGINGLASFPDRGLSIEGDRREIYLPFGDSGYVVQYRVDPGVVVVARIFHMREHR